MIHIVLNYFLLCNNSGSLEVIIKYLHGCEMLLSPMTMKTCVADLSFFGVYDFKHI